MNKSSDPLLGRMIRGYCLEELLKSDTITIIYRARTEELWQTPELNITLLNLPEAISTRAREQFMARFMHEAKRIVRLRHTFLFPLFGYGKQDRYPYLLTPNASGTTLATYLKKKQRWSPSEAFTILVPIATALNYIHSHGLVYQFLNPANIFLQDTKVPQIAELNYCQILCMEGLNDETTDSYAHLKDIAGAYLGEPEYLAPEVVRGAKADARSDIYSLGIILFELLSGHPPFTGRDYLEVAQMHVYKPLPSIHDNASGIPIALELVLNHALHRNPENRFQNPEEFVTAYAHVLDGQSQAQKRSRLTSTPEQVRTLPTSASPKKPKMQSFEREQEDDSWLNASGPVQSRLPEKEQETLNNQPLSSKRSLPSVHQKRSKIER